MKPNRLKTRLMAGEAVYGTICTQGSADSVEIAAHAGFDFVFVDWQHGAFTRDSVREAVRAVQTTDTTPIVRVPAGADPYQIEYVLDSGYPALIFPMVNNTEEARRLVDIASFPPRGHRSAGSCRAPLYFGADYYDKINGELLLMAFIEHIESVGQTEAIMAVDGINGSVIGPSDLSVSLGIPLTLGASDHPELERAIGKILAGTITVGKIPGIYVNTPEQARCRVQQGFRFIIIGYEYGLIAESYRNIITRLKGDGRATDRSP